MTIRSPQSVLMWFSFLAWDKTAFAHISGTQNLLYLQSTFSYNRASSLVMNPVDRNCHLKNVTTQTFFFKIIAQMENTLWIPTSRKRPAEVKPSATVRVITSFLGMDYLPRQCGLGWETSSWQRRWWTGRSESDQTSCSGRRFCGWSGASPPYPGGSSTSDTASYPPKTHNRVRVKT